jgi:coenzyme F420-reducing hydrogenase delta subunit
MAAPKVIVFTCNWGAYGGLEAAGAQQLSYSSAVRPIKVMCLGRLSPGIILKAFQKGASGVLLLGCPPGECHYEFGNRRAEQVVQEARDLVALLGYSRESIELAWIAAGEGEAFADQVRGFLDRLNGSHAS